MFVLLLSSLVVLADEPTSELLPTVRGARTVERATGYASVGLGTSIGIGPSEVGAVVPITSRIDVRPHVRVRPSLSFFPVMLGVSATVPFRFEVARNPASSVAFVVAPEAGYDISARSPMFGGEAEFLASWRATPAPAVGTWGVEASWLGFSGNAAEGTEFRSYSNVLMVGGVEGRAGAAMLGMRLHAGVLLGDIFDLRVYPAVGFSFTVAGPSKR